MTLGFFNGSESGEQRKGAWEMPLQLVDITDIQRAWRGGGMWARLILLLSHKVEWEN